MFAASVPRMSDVSTVPVDAFDGVHADRLRELLGVPAVHLFASVESTLDVAHRLAQDGAVHGTLVLADAQTRGRGRGGKRWASAPGVGVWLTLVTRPGTAADIRVLTVRIGLRAAQALDGFAGEHVGLKWPNDLHLGHGKLAGVLVEARWRGATPEWLAIGFGLNVVAPSEVGAAAGLRPGTGRIDVLRALVPALLGAAEQGGDTLGSDERDAFAMRDIAAGRRATAPAEGVVRGINQDAELVIATASGDAGFRSGSLVLSEDT
jgi:BirA family transcriptional regulator, biotin operon repressor / biotin---[acetyl-CoA-carboxylase] ligase